MSTATKSRGIEDLVQSRVEAGEALVSFALMNSTEALKRSDLLLSVESIDVPDGNCRLLWSGIRRVLQAGNEPDLASVNLTIQPEKKVDTNVWIGQQIDGRHYPQDPSYYVAKLREYNSRLKGAQALDQASRLALSEGAEAAKQATEEGLAWLENAERQDLPWVDVGTWIERQPAPITWLMENFLALGDISLLVGPSGARKSWVTLDLAVSIAAGIEPLGQFPAIGPAPVMLVDEENPQEEVHRRLRAICEARGILPGVLDGMLHITEPCSGFSFREPWGKAALLRAVSDHTPVLVILDSLTAVSTINDEADAVQVRRFFHDHLYPIRRICGSTILCVHHTNKAAEWGTPTKDQSAFIRGSQDYKGASDSGLMLLPDGKNRSILSAFKVRRGQAPDSLAVEIVQGTEGGARPMVVGPADQEPGLTEHRDGSKSGKTIQMLEDNLGRRFTIHELVKLTGASKRTIQVAMKDPRVKYSGGSGPGDIRLYWMEEI